MTRPEPRFAMERQRLQRVAISGVSEETGCLLSNATSVQTYGVKVMRFRQMKPHHNSGWKDRHSSCWLNFADGIWSLELEALESPSVMPLRNNGQRRWQPRRPQLFGTEILAHLHPCSYLPYGTRLSKKGPSGGLSFQEILQNIK